MLDWRKNVAKDNHVLVATQQAALPVEILPHLYLGDAKSAKSRDRLQELGITHILNAAGPAARTDLEGFEQLEFNAEDEENYPMLQKHLEDARAFIASAKDAGGKCLVHCVAGISRSGVLVAAEYMLATRTSVLETVAHSRMQRSNSFLWNEGFQEELVCLARREGLLGPKPGEASSIVAVVPAPPQPGWQHRLPRATAKDALASLT